MPDKPLRLPAHDPKVKKIILEGISILQLQANPNVAKVAQELTATHGIICPYHTLYRRFTGSTQAASDAHTQQQLLSPAAETVLVDWLIFLGETDHGINKSGLRARVMQTCGKKPGDKWIDLSSPGTRKSFSERLADSIQNGPRHLIVTLLTTISPNSLTRSRSITYPGNRSIIWTRKDANVEGAGGLHCASSLSHEQTGQNIGQKVQISSLLLLLNASAPMELSFPLDLSSLGKNLVRNGSKLIQTSGEILSVTMSSLPSLQYWDVPEWMDGRLLVHRVVQEVFYSTGDCA